MTDGIAIMYNLSDFYLPVYSCSSSYHVIAICALRNLSQQTGAAVHRTTVGLGYRVNIGSPGRLIA